MNISLPKKQCYNCAWCNSNNTITLNKYHHVDPEFYNYPEEPTFPSFDPLRNYPKFDIPRLESQKRFNQNIFNPIEPVGIIRPKRSLPLHPPFIPLFKPTPMHNICRNFNIKCIECFKYSNVQIKTCSKCHNFKTIIIKLEDLSEGIQPNELPAKLDDKFLDDTSDKYICYLCNLVDSQFYICNHEWIPNDLNNQNSSKCSKCGDKKESDIDLYLK
jgi:hypothetical protein